MKATMWHQHSLFLPSRGSGTFSSVDVRIYFTATRLPVVHEDDRFAARRVIPPGT